MNRTAHLADKLPTLEDLDVSKLLANPSTDDVMADLDAAAIQVIPDHFVDQDGNLCITSETGQPFIDYYGEFRGGYPYIDPKLEAWAKANGCYWEWANPAYIALYPL